MHAADGGRVRPAGRGIVILRVVLAFAAGVLFLAPRAFAQTVLTPNPAVLQAAQLNGASVTLQAPAGGRFGFAAALDDRWSASGAPAGVTVTVVTAAEPKLTHGRTRANLVIQATGSSTREWNLYIIGTNFAVDGSSGDVSFGPIRVQLPPPGVTLSPSAATVTRELSITEGGNATYNVQLGQQPQGSVNVQIRTPSGSEVSTNPSGLVFNTSNWNTARVVTVTARDDANVVGETVRIRHFVQDAQSSNDYDPAPDAHLTVHVTDNDTPTIRVSQQGPLRLTEGGSGTFTVALGQPPSGTVVVEVQSGDRGVVTVNGPSSGFVDIAFTPSNWNTALTVTVGAVHDGDLEDEAVSMTIGVSPADTVDEFDSAAGTSFTVQVTDDDGLRVVPRTTTVGEGSSTGATYTVALKSQPSGAVTVSVGVPSGDASAVNVAPTALTYTGGSGGNWGTAQTVTVSAGTGANDADAADRAVTLSHAVTGAAPYAYAAQAADDVTVTIEDDETAAVVLSRSAEVALREGERTTYTVRLSAPPAVGNVVVRVRSDDAAVEVNKAGGTAGASQDLTFSATTWNTGQAITVEAVEDGNAAHAAVTLTHAVVAGSSADEYDAAAAVTLAVAVTDDEGAEIAVSRGTGELALMESTGTTSATYTVRLSVQPTGPVTVGVRSDDVGAVTVGPGTLAYSTTNWATGQTVTVAAVGDTDATHERVTVTHAVGAGSAAEYLTTGAVRFTVRVADGNAGLSVRPRAVTVTEGGTGVPYTLALSTAPTGPVTVAVAVAGTPALVAAVPAALTFTTGNWNTARAVTVTPTSAADDIDGVDPAAVTVSHTAASSDASYTITTARTTEQVTVTIEDDETPGVRVSPLRLTVQEDPTAGGGTNRHVGTYTLELTSGISGDDATEAVGIRVTSSNRDAVQVQTGWDPFTPGSGQWRVIFQPSNWNVPRTVTVLAQSDSDGRDETVTVNNEYFAFDGDVTDQGYNQFNDPPPSPHNVTVTVVDDEEPALVVDTAPGTAGVQTGALEVREGSTATAAYTLALGVVPTGAVTVTVGNGDATAVTLAPAALTFSTTTWATAQTVVATPAANDADGEHERVTVTHTLTGAEEYIPPALPAASVPTVTVNVTDDDAASARIYTSVPAALVQHALDGARVGIEVTNTTWASGVATTAAVGDYFALDTAVPGLRLDRIYSVPSTRTVQLALAYDGSDFDTAQTLTVRVLAAAHTGSDVLATGTRTVEPTRGVEASVAAVTVVEEATATYTLRLTSPPTGAVTVSVASSDNPDVTVAPAVLTFTGGAGGNWNTAQAVTVSAADDGDGADETATLAHTAAAGSQDPGYTFATARTRENVAVTVTDNDAPGLAVDPTTLMLTEQDATAGSGTYTVALATAPSGLVTLTATSGDAAVTVAPTALTYGATTWNTAQTVTATAVDDGDDDGETVTVTHAVSGTADATSYPTTLDLTAANVTVTVTDNDTPGLAVGATALTANGVNEGATATYTVALTVLPTGPVTVTVSSNNADVPADVDGDAGNGTQTTLTYSPTNWNTGQTVTVRAGEDDDGVDDAVTWTHASSGANYNSVTNVDLAFTVNDDDTIGVVVDTDPGTTGVQTAALSVTEDGTTTTDTYTVVLATEPTGPVTVTVSDDTTTTVGVNDLDKVSAVPGALTFSTTSWATAQTVTVAGREDVDGDNEAVSLAHVATSGDAGYAGVTIAAVTVNVADNDAPGFLVSPTALALTEGASGSYTLRLNSQPGGPVTVTVGAPTNTDVTGAPGSLTFAAGAWNTAQTVTVSVASDTDGLNETATVTHTATSSDSNYTIATARPAEHVTVTVTDANPPGLAVTPTTLALTEEHATAGSGTYTVRLNALPGGLVTVSVTSGDAAVTVAPTALTYGATTWNTAQTVTATAVDDGDDDGETVTVTHAVSGTADTTSYPTTLALTAANVTVTVTDNDVPGLAVGATALTANGVDEGMTATYTLRLTTLPTGPVTVTVSSNNADVPADVDGDASNGAQATLTYTTASWETAQTVTVRAADDDDAVDDAVTWTHDPSGANYDSVTNVALTFTVNDADTRAVVVDTDLVMSGPQTTALAVTEEHATLGRTAYTVALGTQPVGGAVTVTITSDGQAVAEPAQLVFTANNWATARTVAAVAQPDDDGNNASVTLTHTAGGADYPAPPAAVTADVTVTVTDDDQPGLWVSTTTLAVAEPGTGTYTVRLNTEPGGAVTVGIADTTSNADVSVGPSALEFSAADWNTAQAVTVTAAADADAADDTATLRHTVTGTGDTSAYPTTLAAVEVAVTVADPDTAAVTVSATALALLETGPGSGTYTVVLGTEPTAPVTVTIASSDAGAVSRAPTALTFGTTTWATAQAVTATAVADADAVDERVTVTHTLTGAAEYVGSAGPPAVAGVTVGAVTVTVEDDEEQGLTLTPPAVTVAEDGAAGTYTVVLDSQPTAPVVVRIKRDNTDVHAMPRLLRYTAISWATAQSVTVRADTDADARADVATLTHTAAGGDYTGLAAETLAVTVTDNDAGVVVSRQGVTVVDGQTARYTVVLAAAPAGPVTVTATSSNTNVVIVGPTQNPASRAVVFTAGNWQTAQAVPVTGIGAGTATLSHTVSGYGSVATAASVAVTVVGTAAGVVIDPLVLRVLEGGPSGTYTVGLATEPTGLVTVTAVVANTNSLVLTTPPVLTFAATSWETAQTITVQGVNDSNTTPGSATIAHTVTGYSGVTSGPDVRVNEDEDLTPTLGAVAAQTYRAGQAVSVRLPGATGGNPPLEYALTGPLPATDLTLPTGLAFAAETRRLQGTPGAAATAATYTLTVTDVNGSTATRDFALTVAANPNRLRFEATVASQTYPLNRAVDPPLSLPAPRGSTNRSLTFYLEPPELPDGLTYVPPRPEEVEGARVYLSGGQIVGTPTEARRGRYTLVVVDAVSGEEDRLPFALETGTSSSEPGPGPEPTDRQPSFGDATVEAQRYTVGTAVTLPLPAATGGDPPLTYTLTPAAVPAGLTYTPPAAAAVTGGTLTGTPTAVQAETTYTLTATDADGDPATLPFTVEVGAADTAPTFGEQTVADQTYTVGTAIPLLTLPAATDGDGRLTYTLTGPAGAEPPAGLRYTPPPVEAPHGGTLSGTPTEAQAVTPYTLTATDADGDAATLTFTIAVVRLPVRVTLADATAVEGRPVEFAVTLSRAVAAPLTLTWTAGRPGSATPGEDYPAAAAGHVTLAAGTTAGTLAVPTLDDRRVEPPETFTVRVTLPADTAIELAKPTAEGRIEDDDTEQARKRSLGMVLAGVGRTLATDAVDVIGDRFVRPPTAAQATVGGQALDLERAPQRGRWRHAAGVAYGVARALGVEVGSPLEGGDGQFGQVRGAAWSTLTRHLRDPHAPTPPLSAWDAPGAFASAPGPGWNGPAAAGWGSPHATGGTPSLPPPPSTNSGTAGREFGPAPDVIRGDESSAGQGLAGDSHFGPAPLPGLAGYSNGLGQLGFDRAHAATPQAVQVGALRAPVQFRRVSGREVLSQSAFELPLSRPAPLAVASATEGTPAAGPPSDPAAQAGAAAWTLWGRGTASGFNGKPKDDFSMDGNVFTGYLGVDYRLQPNVLLGLAVAHSRGDVDYETADVTKGDVDVTLTSILPYAHCSPRPGLGVWGMFGAGWGDLKLRDEAGKVKTDLEMLLGAVGARQEVLTWRQIDVALKADAFLTELEADSDDRLPKTAGDAQRLRLMVEGRTAWALSEDSHLTPVFEVGGRWDGGKAETGVGAEMGGGVEYAHTKLGLGIEARGRYLLAHQKSAFDEWGASLTLRLDPGADKRGLWLALAPVWGAEASQVEQLWGSADVLRATGEMDTPPGLSPAQVEFDVGYGMVTHEGAGLLTTYGGLSMMGPESHGVRLGGRLALGEWIDLSVEGERTTQGGGAEHQVALYGHLGW